MTTPNETKDKPAGGTTDPNAPITQGGTAVVDEPSKKKDDPPARASATETKVKDEPAKSRKLKDDEEPEEEGEYTLSAAALRSRISRASKKQLRDQFGTDDPTEVKAKLDKLEKLEKAQEEERRAKLAKEQQLQEDLEKEKQARTAAEKRAEAAENRRVVDKEYRRVTGVASKHIDEDLVEDAVERFRKHLRTMDDKDIESMTQKEEEKWFADLAKEKPKFAKVKADDKRGETQKVPLTNGARTARPDSLPAGGSSEKTFKPGQPNSYTKEEMRKMGYTY